MDHQGFSHDEHMAASAVASLASGKHERESTLDVEMRDYKRSRLELVELPKPASPAKKAHVMRALRPAPWFFYKDFSEEPDPDPLTPLTAPGRVPNFPAKMHAILSHRELRDIVAWLPHGRSWRVLKPREFEIKVLPKFFEHAKFSSFVRQANGWGFRRITQGPDRNSYYHEKFLRGLPHLSKDMKRPGVAEKKVADPSHEPDFYAISQMHPLPDRIAEDESILLQCTLQNGPRARVPIYSGGSLSAASLLGKTETNNNLAAPTAAAAQGGPYVPPPSVGTLPPMSSFLPPPTAPTPSSFLALQGPNPTMSAAALNASTAASQFAAGFAAATAFSQHQFRHILDSLAQQHLHQQKQQQSQDDPTNQQQQQK